VCCQPITETWTFIYHESIVVDRGQALTLAASDRY
jgi:hypothetical protein